MAYATIAALPNMLRAPRRGPASNLGAAVFQLRKLLEGWFDPYRPELHYMRGPGPKWREKHGNRAPR
jgi:hypothetical protein